MRTMNARASHDAVTKVVVANRPYQPVTGDGLARTAEGISRAIYASKEFTVDAFLSDFAHVKPRAK